MERFESIFGTPLDGALAQVFLRSVELRMMVRLGSTPSIRWHGEDTHVSMWDQAGSRRRETGEDQTMFWEDHKVMNASR